MLPSRARPCDSDERRSSRLVVHVQPPAAARFVFQPGCGVSVVVFDPHPPSCVVSQSKCLIRVPWHVLHVTVRAHARIEEYGDGGPSAFRKAAPEKAVHGGAGLPQACCIGDADHSAVAEKASVADLSKAPGPTARVRPGASSPRTTGPAAPRDWSSSSTRLPSVCSSVALRHANSMSV